MPRDRYDDDDDDDYVPRRPRRSYRESESTGLAVASLVLGIISTVLFCIWFIGIPCGILAIIFGALNTSRAGKGMATAGIVLGIIGSTLLLLFVFGALAFVKKPF